MEHSGLHITHIEQSKEAQRTAHCSQAEVQTTQTLRYTFLRYLSEVMGHCSCWVLLRNNPEALGIRITEEFDFHRVCV